MSSYFYYLRSLFVLFEVPIDKYVYIEKSNIYILLIIAIRSSIGRSNKFILQFFTASMEFGSLNSHHHFNIAHFTYWTVGTISKLLGKQVISESPHFIDSTVANSPTKKEFWYFGISIFVVCPRSVIVCSIFRTGNLIFLELQFRFRIKIGICFKKFIFPAHLYRDHSLFCECFYKKKLNVVVSHWKLASRTYKYCLQFHMPRFCQS